MMINEAIQLYLESYPDGIRAMFLELRELVYQSTSQKIEEKMWARLPSYYAGTSFVRLIPFKDHINIEASGVLTYREALTGYKMTPKGMLQIYPNQEVPTDILKQIFNKTFYR